MEIKKALTSLVLAGSLTLSTFSNLGCRGDLSGYTYQGQINGNQVAFRQDRGFAGETINTLTVKKADGRVITYTDSGGGDLELNFVEITKDKQITRYHSNNEVEEEIMREAQKQFDDYLKRIKEIKTTQGLRELN